LLIGYPLIVISTKNQITDYILKRFKMKERDILIKEIEELPDFMIENLLGIIRYLKIGIENEFIPKSENDFYQSEEFQSIVSESIKEYRDGKTEDMDTF